MLNNWNPRSVAQSSALNSPAEILLFGGAAGSLKSETMLVAAAAHRERSRYRGILLRRSFPELERSLIRRSRELYGSAGGVYNDTKRRWTFPSGAIVEFGYCEREDDVHRYQGAEFGFIGFDESTHFSEFPIRYMLSRLRSTDPSLPLRVRLASNPGNIGHVTHKSIFLGGYCHHCQPRLARQTGVSYNDAVWPSDGRRIGKWTAFIPGRVTDHDLLGPNYIQNLESLGGAFRKALLDGCWDVYQGQYFDNWRPQTMVMPRARIGERLGWPHWVGVDYGFNVSQAAAYLLCKSPATPEYPEGITYVLEELTARHQTAADFACVLRRRFLVSGRRIVAWYLSPDAWSQRGDGYCLADQMQSASGLGFTPASTDRVGGAMLLYSRLDRGALIVAEGCRQLVEALPSRIHDPDRPDDIRKVAGDPLDDCIDALRYAVYSFIAPARPEAAEIVAAAVTSSDPTIAMLQRRVAEERLRQSWQPISYLGPRIRSGRLR